MFKWEISDSLSRAAKSSGGIPVGPAEIEQRPCSRHFGLDGGIRQWHLLHPGDRSHCCAHHRVRLAILVTLRGKRQ